MSDILRQIATSRQMRVNRLKREKPLATFRGDMPDSPAGRFRDAVASRDRINIVAELKKASPSKGVLISDFNVSRMAEQYRDGGACALSVLTEEEHFQGRAEYMAQAGRKANLPVLCKDFLVDPYQIYYAKLMEADAVLLIVGLHTPESLADFIGKARNIGLDCLVEVHDEHELEAALNAGADIIGVNNRNLSDLSVSLQTSEKLAAAIPDDVIKVAESGICTAADISRLKSCGYNSFLVGEALVASKDPVKLLKSLRQA